jgi:hypothetical protein
MNSMNRYNDIQFVERFTEPLQRFNLFDQPFDKYTDIQKYYNNS